MKNNPLPHIEIDKAEVLKQLGYPDSFSVEKSLDSICDACIAKIEHASRPAFLYSYFPVEHKSNAVALCNTPLLLQGDSIRRHLALCTRVAVFCVTLSGEIDTIIMRAKFDALQQLLLDTAASVYVEQICAQICTLIQSENANAWLTQRYGIGYGDLSLVYQQDILTLLNAQKRIGVLSTNDGILTPRKSVTAIVGLSSKKIDSVYVPCDSCLLRNDCNDLKRGAYCGK